MALDSIVWRDIEEFYSLIFEFLFVGGAYFVFREKIILWVKPRSEDLISYLSLVIFGIFIYRAADWIHVPSPFDLSGSKTVMLLLVLAPILEELIFRMALWESSVAVFNRPKVTIIVTSVLFALGHFLSYWAVPPEYKTFILYQTVFTFLLSLVIGMHKLKRVAVSSAIFMHFSFNFGFYVSSHLFSK